MQGRFKRLRFRILIPILLVSSFMLSACEPILPTGELYYFRLMWNADAATSATIGWASKEDPGPDQRVYYDVVDHGTNVSQYSFSEGIATENTSFNMNNAFARLRNLRPKTKYYFVIADSKNVSPRFWFETASDDPRDPLSIIAGGDSRNNSKVRRNANLLVAKIRPHAVLFGGDMVDVGLDLEWKEWFQDWQHTIAPDGRMTPVVITRGNHEVDNKILVDLFDTPPSVYYATSIGGSLLRVYTLNSEISIAGNQSNWLEQDLAANTHFTWKIAQYHRPMRPHVKKKLDDDKMYKYWAPLFFKFRMDLVVESDAHTVKSTWPLRPSNEPGNELGFIRDDENGTVFVGEGCWGAPLRKDDDIKSWTRDSGMFNHFNWIFLSENTMEIRTVKVDNAPEVGFLNDSNRFEMPANIDIWRPANGELITINR